jgi:hypothetical protein
MTFFQVSLTFIANNTRNTLNKCFKVALLTPL